MLGNMRSMRSITSWMVVLKAACLVQDEFFVDAFSFSSSLHRCPGISTASHHGIQGHATLCMSQDSAMAEETAEATTSTVIATPQETAADDHAKKLRAEAERIRLEAAKMDAALTLSKIEALEKKLNNKLWLEKHPEEIDGLKKQLEALNGKLNGTSNNPTTRSASRIADKEPASTVAKATTTEASETFSSGTDESISGESQAARKIRFQENPIAGYDTVDLELYIPVVNAIEERMSNATLEEKLDAFRAAEELQAHFQAKIQKMLVEPMQDMIRLESLKQEYLASTSSMERSQIKREMKQLEKSVHSESSISYSDSIHLKTLHPMSDEEIEERLEAVSALPEILQGLLKQRLGLDISTGDLRLAIELDHYELQLQLLEQARFIEPSTNEIRHEARIAFLSLPQSVRDHFAQNLGLDDGSDVNEVLETMFESDEEQWLSLEQVMSGSTNNEKPLKNLAEYDDIDFVDRSRYVEEFLPSFGRMEIIRPNKEDVDLLVNEVFDKKAFMVTSKPERVLGGYYIRGQNLLATPEDSRNGKLVSQIQERLAKSSLADKIEMFYIHDPTPPTDEEYELELTERPLFAVMAKEPDQFYDIALPRTKALVSLAGFFSIALYALATCEMQPALQEQLQAVAAGTVTEESLDLSGVVNNAFTVATLMVVIQLFHEAAHRVVAWKDKFEVGVPNIIPNIQLGLLGAITPLRSPPPNLQSMFDFAMAGPLTGLLVSIMLLVTGLEMTAAMDIEEAMQLPALPVFLIESSALGGGLVELFLGKGAVSAGAEDSVLPLHPFAIAGFVGALSNSLALLPLGNTDGGRIALAMFGRKGAHLVKSFTALILAAVGLFGLDPARLLLTYTLFGVIWQRELETPAYNEVDELDFSRGLLGIGVAAAVFLILLPMI